MKAGHTWKNHHEKKAQYHASRYFLFFVLLFVCFCSFFFSVSCKDDNDSWWRSENKVGLSLQPWSAVMSLESQSLCMRTMMYCAMSTTAFFAALPRSILFAWNKTHSTPPSSGLSLFLFFFFFPLLVCLLVHVWNRNYSGNWCYWAKTFEKK